MNDDDTCVFSIDALVADVVFEAEDLQLLDDDDCFLLMRLDGDWESETD